MIVLDVLADMNSVFEALFFGDGSWLGLLLMLMFIVGLTMAWKHVGVLMMLVAGMFGVVYLTEGLGLHGVIMIITAIFILIHVTMESRKD